MELELSSSSAHNRPTTVITALASPLQCLHQRPGRYEPKWTQQDSHTGRWWTHKLYTKHQRTPRKQPKQCNNWIVYPRGIMTLDLSSIQTRHKQQSNRQTSASSHIWWSCVWMTKSSEIPWHPLWQNADLQKKCVHVYNIGKTWWNRWVGSFKCK